MVSNINVFFILLMYAEDGFDYYVIHEVISIDLIIEFKMIIFWFGFHSSRSSKRLQCMTEFTYSSTFIN